MNPKKINLDIGSAFPLKTTLCFASDSARNSAGPNLREIVGQQRRAYPLFIEILPMKSNTLIPRLISAPLKATSRGLRNAVIALALLVATAQFASAVVTITATV